MTHDILLSQPLGSTMVLTLNRPDKRNALCRELIAALTEAVTSVDADPAVRCVILTGAGNAFCAGMDLDELRGSLTVEREIVWEDAQRLSALYDAIFTSSKPFIAAVNGHAVAGGAGLVTVCDLAVSIPTAKFGYPEVRRGLVAAMVMPHLLRHVGERLARYLLLTGELIDASSAERAGLINAVSADPMATALAWADAIAAGGPSAMTTTKDLLRRSSRQALTLDDFARASAEPRLGDECRQGLEAFFAKRPAPWLNVQESPSGP